MDQSHTISQKIRKVYPGSLEAAIRYFGVMSVLNDLGLSNRKLQLLGFLASRDGVLSGGTRSEFVQHFKSSKATINNMTSELQEAGLLVKIGRRIMLNPKLTLDFNNPVILQITLDAHR